MTDAIRSNRPGRNTSGDSHDVDKDAQGGREVDAAAEQNAEIAAKQTGAVKLEDAGDAGDARDRGHDHGARARPTKQPPDAGQERSGAEHHAGRVRTKKVRQLDENAERGV